MVPVRLIDTADQGTVEAWPGIPGVFWVHNNELLYQVINGRKELVERKDVFLMKPIREAELAKEIQKVLARISAQPRGI